MSAFESPDAVPLIDAYNTTYPAYTPPAFTNHQPTARQRDMSVYLQDQLRYGNWIAVAGLRLDRSKNIIEDRDQVSRATSKRLGIKYESADGGLMINATAYTLQEENRLVDAMLAYETPSWRYAINANNLFDKTYVSTCLS